MAAASVLLASGCAAGRPGPAPRASAHAAASSRPAASGIATGARRRALAAQYLRIAQAGNRRLEIDFDGLRGPDRRDLAAARADLRDAAATERLFDRRLMAIAFPAATEAAARALFRLNQSRARLTAAAAAAATSLGQLRAYDRIVAAANAPVESAVRAIRRQLGLPPPETS
jgi:hypothetical protein